MMSRRTLGLTTIIALLLAFAANLLYGSASVSLHDAWHGWMNLQSQQELSPAEDLAYTIIVTLRLPRALLALMCGAALAMAGVVSQGLFRNSLASPSIIGTSAGASLAAVVLFYFGAAYWHWLSLPLAAFAGAAVTTGLILLLPQRRGIPALGSGGADSIEQLLLIGFALNAFLGSLTSLTLSLVLEDQQKAAAVMHWLLGGLTGKGVEHVGMLSGPLVIGAFGALALAARLDVLSLGEEVARSLGVHVGRLRLAAIAVMALLVGGTVAVAGAIPFVGLIIPHVTRLFVGPGHKKLVLWSAVNGMTLMLVADLVARTVRSPVELEVGVLTSLLGAPFFAWLLLSRRTTGGVS